MSHWESCDAIERHPEKMSVAWIFKNTRLQSPRCSKL